MTDSDERIDAVMEAYLDYLGGVGEEPSLADLEPDEQTRVLRLVASLTAGRGIDPYASRPSLEQLLAGTEFEPALDAAAAVHDEVTHDVVEAVRDEMATSVPYSISVSRDHEAAAIGIRSDLVAVVLGQRLRIQIRPDVDGLAALRTLDPAAAAGPVYGAFPDTAGVIVVYPDSDLSSIAFDPFDTEYCIQVPAGSVERPTARRAVLPLANTVRSYLEELVPALETGVGFDVFAGHEIEPAHVARAAALKAISTIAAEGARAKIKPKIETWSPLGDTEVEALSGIVLEAMAGLDAPALEARIQQLMEVA